MVRPKKHLGQHFLTDESIAKRIAELLSPPIGNTVLEIGPGKGVLSKYLLKRDFKDLRFIEIDHESVEFLKTEFPGIDALVTEGDFLNLNLKEAGNKISIIGNFPYNISSQIFFKLIEEKEIVEEVVCMIQKEVAQRIVSPPGSKQYGILSVLLQTWFDIKMEFSVKPGSFFPPPAVQSSVIKLKRNNRKQLPCDEKLYYRLIKAGFNQRRKVLSNSLGSIFLHLGSESERLGLRRRPEELSVDNFIDLTAEIEKLIKQTQ
jgi:16S rRNA (adenine1518-N6/adenine1519-N6)-dimethyltransferase